MYKAGQIVPFRVRLLTTAGVAESYASKVLFLAAGYTVNLTIAGAAVSPTWTWVVIDAAQGDHDIMLTVQEGEGSLTVTEPAGHEVWPRTRPVSAEPYNIGSIIAAINTTAGAPVNQDRTLVTDFSVVEGDSLLREVTVPLLALQDWGYDDLTDSGWIVTAAARLRANRLVAEPDFILGAYVTDALNRIVTLSLNPFATGAALSAVDATIETLSRLWDLQLRNTKVLAISALHQGNKTFSITGDYRKFFSVNTLPVTQFTVTGSTGNNATYTVVSVTYTGGATVITVSEAIPNAVADGSINVGIRFTPNKGTITTGRQEDRT